MASDFYTEIDAALAAYLRAWPDLAEVRTIESDVRDAIFEDSAPLRIQAFRADELPAINVSVQISPAASRPRTSTRLTYEIPLFVAVVVRATTGQAVREQARRFQREVEAALHLLRGTNQVLGHNCNLTGDLVSSPPVISIGDQTIYSGVATVEGTVFKSVDKGA